MCSADDDRIGTAEGFLCVRSMMHTSKTRLSDAELRLSMDNNYSDCPTLLVFSP